MQLVKAVLLQEADMEAAEVSRNSCLTVATQADWATAGQPG